MQRNIVRIVLITMIFVLCVLAVIGVYYMSNRSNHGIPTRPQEFGIEPLVVEGKVEDRTNCVDLILISVLNGPNLYLLSSRTNPTTEDFVKYRSKRIRAEGYISKQKYPVCDQSERMEVSYLDVTKFEVIP